MEEKGYVLGNIDCTIIAQKPKLSPHKVWSRLRPRLPHPDEGGRLELRHLQASCSPCCILLCLHFPNELPRRLCLFGTFTSWHPHPRPMQRTPTNVYI